ncbi:hypothetical protein [Muricoccus radiodurans]|uniref:hypothetical protein n=1 Tax=Muricoccus radiodurans TaxID=2231721 RepID=UPI003CEB4F58
MIRAATLALALGLLFPPAPAAAQRAGTYQVEGTDPAGSPYSGTATFTALDGKTWRITWRIDGESGGAEGIGLVAGGLLVVGYTISGAPGIATYQPQPDGSLVGPWTSGQGLGSERLVPR